MLKDAQIGLVMRRALEKGAEGNELKLLLTIATNYGATRCDLSNIELARKLEVSDSAISKWVSSMVEKNILGIVLVPRRHCRYLYLKGIESKYEAPPFELMSEAQQKFARRYPKKEINCEVPNEVDMDLLLEEMEKSEFLRTASNVSLKSCCRTYYQKIMAGDYRDPQFKKNGNDLLGAAARLGAI